MRSRTTDVFSNVLRRHTNCSPVRDNHVAVQGEISRLEATEYIRRHGSWSELDAAHHGVVVSELAALIKERPDGTTLLRLTVDMLRAPVNEFVTQSKRIVLPRLSDVRDLVSLLSEALHTPEGWRRSWISSTLSTLGVHPEDQRHQVIAGSVATSCWTPTQRTRCFTVLMLW